MMFFISLPLIPLFPSACTFLLHSDIYAPQKPVPTINITRFQQVGDITITDALGVTLDYLVKDGELKVLNKQTLKRLEDIENRPEEDKNHIFYTLDNLIKAAKFKAI